MLPSVNTILTYNARVSTRTNEA